MQDYNRVRIAMILQIFSENETWQYQRNDVIEMEFASYFYQVSDRNSKTKPFIYDMGNKVVVGWEWQIAFPLMTFLYFFSTLFFSAPQMQSLQQKQSRYLSFWFWKYCASLDLQHKKKQYLEALVNVTVRWVATTTM